MPGPTSLLDGYAPASPAPPPTGGGAVTPGRYSQASVGALAPVGTAPITGSHNTSLHVAMWGLGSLGFIILMHKWGFRLVSVGRYGGGR